MLQRPSRSGAAKASILSSTSGAARCSACGSPACASPHLKHGIGWPLAAFALALVGALAFVGGATLQLWPIWVAGLVAVCGAVVAYRP
jgi:Flp pilus assembly protein TadB